MHAGSLLPRTISKDWLMYSAEVLKVCIVISDFIFTSSSFLFESFRSQDSNAAKSVILTKTKKWTYFAMTPDDVRSFKVVGVQSSSRNGMP